MVERMLSKGALSGLRQFLATESLLKMKNHFYFTLKFHLALKTLNFCLDFLFM